MGKVAIEEPRILILGSGGQLGRALARSFAGMGTVHRMERADCDLADADSVRARIRAVRPSLLLNAAAYTGVDRAESEPALAYAINGVAPGAMAEEANRLDAVFVHYSTDYVFDGSKTGPWVEEDPTGPLNVYGASKLAGEQAVAAAGGKHLVFRTSWVYGPEGKNFLLTMLRLGKERERLSIVDDQIGAPTSSLELAAATRRVVEGIQAGRCGLPAEWSGIYHMSCAGQTSWYGFARDLFARAAVRCGAKMPEVLPIRSEEYPTPARRPHNSVLSNRRLQERFGVHLAPWEQALDAVFELLPR